MFVDDFDGTVFHSAIMDIDVVAETATDLLLRVGSGVNWDALVAYTVEKGWCGLENLSLIPGEVGASAVQNVGAYGVEAGDLIEKVETVRIADAVACSFTKADCAFAYRHSIFKAAEKGRHIVTYVTYRLQKSACFKLSYGNLKDKVEELGGATLANVRRAVCEIREAKLPNPEQVGSAGSCEAHCADGGDRLIPGIQEGNRCHRGDHHTAQQRQCHRNEGDGHGIHGLLRRDVPLKYMDAVLASGLCPDKQQQHHNGNGFQTTGWGAGGTANEHNKNRKYLGKEVLLIGSLTGFVSQAIIGLFLFNRTVNGMALLTFMFLGSLVLAHTVTIRRDSNEAVSR